MGACNGFCGAAGGGTAFPGCSTPDTLLFPLLDGETSLPSASAPLSSAASSGAWTCVSSVSLRSLGTTDESTGSLGSARRLCGPPSPDPSTSGASESDEAAPLPLHTGVNVVYVGALPPAVRMAALRESVRSAVRVAVEAQGGDGLCARAAMWTRDCVVASATARGTAQRTRIVLEDAARDAEVWEFDCTARGQSGAEAASDACAAAATCVAATGALVLSTLLDRRHDDAISTLLLLPVVADATPADDSSVYAAAWQQAVQRVMGAGVSGIHGALDARGARWGMARTG
ncbi:hypothetical protein MSPP1_001925 [Malassezia sp. CBS 17886]|nr:hypothetical protein MSPP1_001925 [Malassezia sp. CBS 17886]